MNTPSFLKLIKSNPEMDINSGETIPRRKIPIIQFCSLPGEVLSAYDCSDGWYKRFYQ
jgi:hypothetical protein